MRRLTNRWSGPQRPSRNLHAQIALLPFGPLNSVVRQHVSPAAGEPTYQLVLQFKATSAHDFDRLLELEDQLTQCLEGLAEVDGHDSGAGEMNIFVLCDSPAQCLQLGLPGVEQSALVLTGAGFRSIRSDQSYTRIWPPNSTTALEVV